MEWMIGALILCAMLLLVFIGMPVAFAMLLTGLAGGYFLFGGEAGVMLMISSIDNALTSFVFLPLLMFLLMGELLFESGYGSRLLDNMDRLLGALPGRLSIVAVAVGTLMSVLTGVHMATTALLGKVLVPDMDRRGYHRSLSLGAIIGCSGLAVMIPPSGTAVIIGGVGQMSIAELLLAGVVPGILMALLYVLYIVGRCLLQPEIAPSYALRTTSSGEKLSLLLREILPIGLVAFLVMGTIFFGIATPSEAAALGVVGSLVVIGLSGSLTWGCIRRAVVGTARLSAMVLILLGAAAVFSQVLALSGLTQGLVEIVTESSLAPIFTVIAVMGMALLMGMFMPPTAVILIVIPLFLPAVKSAGFNEIWFAVLLLINCEMASSTPPLGGVLFAMKAVAPSDVTMGQIYRAAVPFLLCDIVVMALIMMFPQLTLWLPELIR